MTVELVQARNDQRFADPALTGEWADFIAGYDFTKERPPWCSYLIECDGEPAGIAGFRGPPDPDGWVEAAYMVFVPLRGRGIATMAARRLIEVAARQGVTPVYGLTLPEMNASTSVLQKVGFTLAGESTDSDEGPVWRWEIEIDPI
ncbi:MAG TPA: GNAT family N-acetyltransferase [Sphingomicrobium sp.]